VVRFTPDELVAHMRFLLGVIFGVLLLVVVVFIADSLATSEGATGAAPRQIVNWDVAAERLHDFTEAIRAGWNKLTR
jgi:uncharacterized membrane protein YoaT (DUF817 family)